MYVNVLNHFFHLKKFILFQYMLMAYSISIL